ncbi:hypothetical protein [Microscilla marina]|nr:hypothetical protein [Microscilla marina]
MDLLDKNVDELYWRLIREYEELFPDEVSPADAKRYFGEIRIIEILENARGRKIRFIETLSAEEEEVDEIYYTYEYEGDPSKEDKLIEKFYDLARPHAIKFEYQGHPVMFRDIIGIEKTIVLLEKASSRYIEVIYNVKEDQENISPDDLEFIILEDDEWYDFETGKIKKEDELDD